MVKALTLDSDEDLSRFSKYLWAQRIPHRISEQAGQQVLWVRHEQDAEAIRSAYQLYQEDALPELHAAQQGDSSAYEGATLRQIIERLASVPLTGFLICISLLVTALLHTQLGLLVFAWLKMESFTFIQSQGQYWRVITPIFLHFGIMHLAFNMVLLWTFGRQLEVREPRQLLLGLLLLFAVIPNVMQYLFSGTQFGGMSGVVYAILGYCWMWDRLNPEQNYAFPKALMGLMVAWLLLGFSDFLTMFGFPSMANAAHLSGLLCGLGAAVGITVIRSNKSRGAL